MAERVHSMPVSKAGAPKYPWDEWLDGSVWELVQGKDFECAIGTMASNVQAAARRRMIRTRVVRRGDRIYIQAQR